MRLTELDPHWVSAGGEGITDASGQPVPHREGVGVTFDCPCGCGERGYIPFENPLDGGPAHSDHVTWHRAGDTFETLTLTPSILKNKDRGGCGWHGYITNGEIITV